MATRRKTTDAPAEPKEKEVLANAEPTPAEEAPAVAEKLSEEQLEAIETAEYSAGEDLAPTDPLAKPSVPNNHPVEAENADKDEKEPAPATEEPRRRKKSAISTFAKGEERVMSLSGEEVASKSVEEYANTLVELSRSQKTGVILRDKLVSVERLAEGIAAVCYHGDFKVYINPAKLLRQEIIDNLVNRNGMTVREAQQYVLSSRIGSYVTYIVEMLDPENNYAVGNHLLAAEVLQRRFYIIKRDDGNPRVCPGKVVTASVIAARKYGVILDIYGFEKYVSLTNMTYSRLDHANQEYSVGDSVEVKVLDVVIEGGKVTDVQVSQKALRSDPFLKAIQRCTPNSLHLGVVERIDENAVFVSIDISGEKVSCYCPYPRVGLNRNSEVTVRITGVDPKERRVWGLVTRVNKI